MTEARFHIVGLDLSLSATGVATIRPHETDPIDRIRLDLVTSKAVPNAKYPHTLARLRSLAGGIVRAVQAHRLEGEIVVVVIEGPAFAATTGQVHTRAGLWWLVYHLVEKFAIVVVIEPSRLKRYVTGRGNAPKDEVFAKMISNFPHVGIVDNNEADALGLAAMAARELGYPMEPSVQRVTPNALESVEWGDFITTQRRTRNG